MSQLNQKMHYVYILKSGADERLYVGLTGDIERRVKEHNQGKVASTIKRIPLNLISFFAFDNRKKAEHFEKYLKTGSGRAFLSKRIL